jgi:hypothetical protein
MRHGLVAALFVLCLDHVSSPAQPVKEKVPSAEAVADMLKKEPISLATWPTWRQQLLAWMHDRGRRADAAYNAARTFVKDQANAQNDLPPALAKDALAWYMLGSVYLYEAPANGDYIQAAARAEKILRKSLALDPSFARTHRNLALAILFQTPAGQPDPRAHEVDKELQEAGRLDPDLPLQVELGRAALQHKEFAEAEKHFQAALQETPDEAGIALLLASTLLQDRMQFGQLAPRIGHLVQRFPKSGELACLNALALAGDNNFIAASKELARARALGTDPAKMVSPTVMQEIESRASSSWPERFGWIMLTFTCIYAAVMLVMALVGLLLAARTRGSRALGLLEASPEHLAQEGQVIRGSSGCPAKPCGPGSMPWL